jgi:hypothetical protein
MPDKHRWLAHYSDETTLAEHDESGRAVGFAAVDQSRLVALEYIPVSGEGGATVRLPAGARPILFRRRHVHASVIEETSVVGHVIEVIGWQMTIDGTNVKSLLALYDDGSVLLTDDSDNL